MSTVDRVLPWRRHHETAASSELTPLLAVYRRRHPEGAGRHDQPRLSHGGRGAPLADPLERRELHQPPAGGGDDRGRHRPRRHLGGGGAAARCRRGHRDHAARRRRQLRRRGRAPCRRRHQVGADPVRLARGPAGGDDAQDAGRDGEGPAGARHQARRPAPQHAHDRRDAARQAAADRPGDARHLRPAGAPARDPGDQAAARGSLVRGAPPQALRRARPPRRHRGRPSARCSSPRPWPRSAVA